ncbi:MAG: helix-turn-helix domain-containing protein [Treponema sp.]|nr:helix-turn-helix domain-containing protein [Treponema sp.]
MNNYRKDFIENLKYYRKQKGITQEKLAELCDVATSTIGCIESAQQYPSFDLLYKMAEVLEIHPANLFLKDAANTKGLDIIHKQYSLPYDFRSSIELMISDMTEKYNANK